MPALPACLELPAHPSPQVLVFQLDTEPPADDDEGEDNTPAYREWTLPAAEFHGSWDTLVRRRAGADGHLQAAASACGSITRSVGCKPALPV